MVLLPETVVDRNVMEGRLGCPVCGRDFPIAGGVARFGAAPPASPDGLNLTGESLAALLGVTGPGGYLALVGSLARLAIPLAGALDGVHVIAMNPPSAGVAGDSQASVLLGPSIPLKARSLRAVALGEGFGAEDRWVREAVRVLLPGLRIVGVGPASDAPGLETLAAADGVWVSRLASAGRG